MKINKLSSINNGMQSKNSAKPNFKHAIRVSICTKTPEATCYTFVQPNDKLYKNLTAKVVRWLNSDFISNIKKVFGIATKPKELPENIQHLINDLKLLDTDYNAFNTVRTAYRKPHIPFFVTGKDEAIVESILNAKNFGILKHESLLVNGYANSDEVREFGKKFKEREIDFVTNPINRLRSKKGKEILLRINFEEQTSKNGDKYYEPESYHFCEIQNGKELTEQEKELAKKRKNIDTINIQMANIEYKLSKHLKERPTISLFDYQKILDMQKKGDINISKPNLIRNNNYPQKKSKSAVETQRKPQTNKNKPKNTSTKK